jgi:hypothetical protein
MEAFPYTTKSIVNCKLPFSMLTGLLSARGDVVAPGDADYGPNRLLAHLLAMARSLGEPVNGNRPHCTDTPSNGVTTRRYNAQLSVADFAEASIKTFGPIGHRPIA